MYSLLGEKAALNLASVNPELPFYYHTSSHDRFYEGLNPEFSLKDQLSKHNPRNQKIR